MLNFRYWRLRPLLRSAGRSNSDENVRLVGMENIKVTFPEDPWSLRYASDWNYDADDNVAHLQKRREIAINYPFRITQRMVMEKMCLEQERMTFSIELATETA